VSHIPTAFQRKTLWTAITALSLAITGGLAVSFIYLLTRVIAFLQPLLIPIAVAAVLAYLLEPVVNWLGKRRVKRRPAVWVVFVAASAIFGGVLLIIIPAMMTQSVELTRYVKDNAGSVRDHAMGSVTEINERLYKNFGIRLLTLPESAESPPSPAPPKPGAAPAPASAATPESQAITPWPSLIDAEWLAKQWPYLVKKAWEYLGEGIGGFLGVFGFVVSLILVPLYLYYFLMEGPEIAESWSKFVPLRASRFKDEVIGTLEEINRYLIAFFRGQLVVSMINGMGTAIGLSILGLKFGWLIGLSLCVLGLVPYMGVAICWIPAVIIATVQHENWFISNHGPWWALPLAVTCVFVVVQQFDSFFVTPHIVGDVGLHPMTVIISVVAWSLVLGGLLGAILAVPMSAAVKVLFQRYIWRRRLKPEPAAPDAAATPANAER